MTILCCMWYFVRYWGPFVNFTIIHWSDLPLVLILSVYTDQTCHSYWFYQCILIRPATHTDFISVYWSDLPLILILSVYTDQTCHLYWFYQCILIRPATYTDLISVYWPKWLVCLLDDFQCYICHILKYFKFNTHVFVKFVQILPFQIFYRNDANTSKLTWSKKTQVSDEHYFSVS